MSLIEEVLAEYYLECSGRTYSLNRKPRRDEVLVEEIERLRAELEEVKAELMEAQGKRHG